MKSKRSHKLAAMGGAGATVASSASIADAAARLGVERSTVWRWVKAGKVPPPGTGPIDPEQLPALAIAAGGQTPEEWAATVRDGHELTGTEIALVGLAADALRVARDGQITESVRLLAMGRYQSLVKHLHLEQHGKKQAEPESSRVVLPTRRVTHDPRRILQAVK